MSYVYSEKFIRDNVIAPFYYSYLLHQFCYCVSVAYIMICKPTCTMSPVRRFGARCLIRCVIRPSRLNVLGGT